MGSTRKQEEKTNGTPKPSILIPPSYNLQRGLRVTKKHRQITDAKETSQKSPTLFYDPKKKNPKQEKDLLFL